MAPAGRAQFVVDIGEFAHTLLWLDSEQFSSCLPHDCGLSLRHDITLAMFQQVERFEKPDGDVVADTEADGSVLSKHWRAHTTTAYGSGPPRLTTPCG